MELLRTCLQDLRYAVRNLLRSRGFAAVAAITLTIGIGANTAIFSIIDTILLRPLPFRDPGQLVRLYETEAAPGHYPFAPRIYQPGYAALLLAGSEPPGSDVFQRRTRPLETGDRRGRRRSPMGSYSQTCS